MSADLFEISILLISGLAAGVLAGLIGVGGGIIFVPVLSSYISRYSISDSQQVVMTIANSLFLACVMGISGSISQYRKKNFFPAPTLWIGIGGSFSSVAMAWVLSHSEVYNKALFNLVFTALLVPLILKMMRTKSPSDTENLEESKAIEPQTLKLTFVGVFTGIISSLSGLGGGVIMIPVLSTWLKYPMKATSSISLSSIVIISFAMSVFYLISSPANLPKLGPLMVGYLNFSLVLPLGLGVALAAPYGVKLAHKTPEKVIRWIFVSFFVIVLLRMYWPMIIG